MGHRRAPSPLRGPGQRLQSRVPAGLSRPGCNHWPGRHLGLALEQYFYLEIISNFILKICVCPQTATILSSSLLLTLAFPPRLSFSVSGSQPFQPWVGFSEPLRGAPTCVACRCGLLLPVHFSDLGLWGSHPQGQEGSRSPGWGLRKTPELQSLPGCVYFAAAFMFPSGEKPAVGSSPRSARGQCGGAAPQEQRTVGAENLPADGPHPVPAQACHLALAQLQGRDWDGSPKAWPTVCPWPMI